MSAPRRPGKLELLDLEVRQVDGSEQEVRFKTNNGELLGRFRPVPFGLRAVIWMSGAAGGLDGPAGGLYPRLAAVLSGRDIGSLRLDYRFPNRLNDCVPDTLMGIRFLESRNYNRFILVGHSFGGAVVIRAGAEIDRVVGVAALSSQTYGTAPASELSPKSLLLIHGGRDEVLASSCSERIYNRARQPKKLIIYPDCGHGLEECRGQLDYDLLHWISQTL